MGGGLGGGFNGTRGSGGIASGSQVKAKGFSPDSLNSHFSKHRSEFDNIDKRMYNRKARDLLNSLVGNSIEGFTSKAGWRFRYNKTTNEFAICDPDGTIVTYFRPNNGLNYWKEQIRKYGP